MENTNNNAELADFQPTGSFQFPVQMVSTITETYHENVINESGVYGRDFNEFDEHGESKIIKNI